MKLLLQAGAEATDAATTLANESGVSEIIAMLTGDAKVEKVADVEALLAGAPAEAADDATGEVS